MNVGDKVGYVPHQIYALAANEDGTTAWKVGRKGRGDEEDEQLEGKELRDFLASVQRSNRTEKIAYIGPRGLWPAVVTKVNPDGTLNIDVDQPRSPATLHVESIKVGDGKEPHTCVESKKEEVRLAPAIPAPLHDHNDTDTDDKTKRRR